MKKIKPERLSVVDRKQTVGRFCTYYGAARDRWITWAFPNTWPMTYPNHVSLLADPERLVGSLLLLGSPALTKSQDTPQVCMITDVTFGRSDEWFPTDEKRKPIPGWLVTLQPQRDNVTAAEQLLGLYATALAIRQTATMDHATAAANFRWGVYPNPNNGTWWVCLEERREDGSFGYADTWSLPELRGKNVPNKSIVVAKDDGSITLPFGFLLDVMDGLKPNSTDTQEAAAAADPAAQAAHAEGFRLLTLPTNSASQQQEAQA